VLNAIKTGDVDFTISNATPARALDVTFSQTLLLLESGYLVPAGSPIVTIADMNKSGLRVGASKGSTSEQLIPKVLANASVVAVPNLKQAIQMLTQLKLDAFATNKAMMPGAHVLGCRWGWSTSRSPFRRVASAGSNSFEASSKICDQAASWRKPSNAQASGALSRRSRQVSLEDSRLWPIGL
jgi:hypothetical protein